MPNLTWLRLREAAKILKIYRAAYRNWPSVLLSLALRGRAKAVTRDGNIIEGNAVPLGYLARLYSHWVECCRAVYASNDLSYIIIEIKGKRIKLHDGWYKIPFPDLDIYSNILAVWGKSVLDIGAFVGDSAILFALMGARRVVAVEPSPWAFNIARRNVEANGLGDIITLVNCAVGREDGRRLMLPLTETDGSFRATDTVDGKVPIMACTLDSLIERYGPFDVLKMDCEGCEYESIPYSRRIGEVKEVLIEYHEGYEDIVRKLREEGFRNMKFSDIREGRLYDGPISAKQGYIYASK